MPELLCMGEPMLEMNQLPPGADGRALYLEGHGGDTSNAAICAARQGASVGYVTAVGQDRLHARQQGLVKHPAVKTLLRSVENRDLFHAFNLTSALGALRFRTSSSASASAPRG